MIAFVHNLLTIYLSLIPIDEFSHEYDVIQLILNTLEENNELQLPQSKCLQMQLIRKTDVIGSECRQSVSKNNPSARACIQSMLYSMHQLLMLELSFWLGSIEISYHINEYLYIDLDWCSHSNKFLTHSLKQNFQSFTDEQCALGDGLLAKSVSQQIDKFWFRCYKKKHSFQTIGWTVHPVWVSG